MEIRDFLVARRAGVTPAQAGLVTHGERRVAGLRREEVAQLAGISVDYYVRLERGHAPGISDAALTAVADALRLDEAERAHLFDLARTRPTVEHRDDPSVPAAVRRVLDAVATSPAYAWNTRLDIVAANAAGRALLAPLFAGPRRPVNQARFLFLDPAAHAFFPDWELLAHDAVAMLRRTRPERLVRELRDGSAAFRSMWASYDVRTRRSAVKRIRHPVDGPLTFTFDVLAIENHPGLRVAVGTVTGEA